MRPFCGPQSRAEERVTLLRSHRLLVYTRASDTKTHALRTVLSHKNGPVFAKDAMVTLSGEAELCGEEILRSRRSGIDVHLILAPKELYWFHPSGHLIQVAPRSAGASLGASDTYMLGRLRIRVRRWLSFLSLFRPEFCS